MSLSVNDLLKYLFWKRSRAVQQQIVAGGRSQLLKHLPMRKYTGNDLNGHFYDPVLFEQVPWLIRCDRRQKYFCWTCLLFMPAMAMVKARMYSDLATILDATGKHMRSAEHIEAALLMQIFIMQNFHSSLRVGDRVKHNILVKKNREVLKRVIDAVCWAVTQKHSHGDGRYTCNLLKVEDCSKFLQFLREQDKANVDLVDGAVELISRCPRIVNDIVDAITIVVKIAIKNETHMSTYVSLILSEHGTPLRGKSQISTILRYIKRGKVCERFVGFSNVIGSNSENDISQLVLNTIDQFAVSDRFLALTVDGKVLKKQSLTNLIAAIKIDYKYSYFVPWHSHGLGNVLLDTLLVYDDCGLFLKKIKAMENFFQNPKCLESFEVSLLCKNPELRCNKWYLTAPFITFVAKYRTYFVEFFDSVVKNCKYWERDDVTKAIAFRTFLQEIHTIFLLNIFYTVFSDVFDETFNFSPENQKEMFVFSSPRISSFKEHVGDLKFMPVWDEMAAEIKRENQNSKWTVQIDDLSQSVFNSLFQKILRHMYQEVDIRCNYLSRLKFCDLLNCNGSGKFVFSPQMVMELMIEHGPFFREKELNAEVMSLNENAIFRKKSVHELLESFADLNLRSVYPQLYKLAEFILTLPYLPASRVKGISKLKDINNCSYVPEVVGIPSGDVSVLCVETEMLRDVKKSPLFYEDVLARFYEVNQSLVLVQV